MKVTLVIALFVVIAAMTVRYVAVRGRTTEGPTDDGVQEIE
jgi:hypothetical protein